MLRIILIRKFFAAFILLLAALLLPCFAASQTLPENKEITVPKNYRAPVFSDSAVLKILLDDAVEAALTTFKKNGLKRDEISATLIDLSDKTNPQTANFAGEKQVYPASVVKMFYMAALQRQLEDKKITLTPELERGLRDMIVDSSNEATQYILDVLTDTSSGAELPQAEFEIWQSKRNRVNRFFAALGYKNINVNQKTFCEDAYGIEQQSRNYKGENRNMLTTNAVGRLLAEIALRGFVTPERSGKMMDLMKRDPFRASADPDSQDVGFTGRAIIERNMRGVRLWSKAGWTTKTRHDAAYIETPEGLRLVIVIFTENHANEREVIPTVAGWIIDRINSK